MVLLLQIRRELARIAVRLRNELERSPQVRWVKSVPGFGLILSHVLLAEIGQLSRFGSSRALAAYSLLAPQSRDTGEAGEADDSPLGRHLGQRGNRTLKWAFIEAAHGAVRHGGRWREMFDRATGGGRKNRGRGYIKVARALVDVVYAVLRDERMFQERRPAPRDSTRKQSMMPSRSVARPGTGRRYHTMVAARR